MADITISDQDRADAESFLASVLTSLYPDADFSPGSVTRDHTIGAVAAVFALLRKEAQNMRRASSLKLAPALEDTASYEEAVASIVSNWFVTPRNGRPATGTALIHFSERHNGTVPPGMNFTKDSGLRYRYSSTTPRAYSSRELVPVYNAAREVQYYTLRVPVTAESAGTSYEVGPGDFSSVDRFNRYVIGGENDFDISGASDDETADELAARTPDAITVRDLISDRSIATVLREEFSLIDEVVVLGFGDEGMRRDLAMFTTGLQMHLGGYVDIFLRTPLIQRRIFEGVVGADYTDARDKVRLFRDDTVADWRTTGVVAGDILRVRNAAAAENSLYEIAEVARDFLRTHTHQAFPGERPNAVRDGASFSDGNITNAFTLVSATAAFSELDVGRYVRVTTAGNAGNLGDFQITAVNSDTNTVIVDPSTLTAESGVTFKIMEGVVEYSIGAISPDFTEKVAPATTGIFSRQFSRDGHVLMPPEPVYFIHEVSVLDAADPDTDQTTGRVQFPNRVNQEVTLQSGADLQFRMQSYAPDEAQSASQMFAVDIGPGVEVSGNRGVLYGANYFQAGSSVFDAATDVGKRIVIPRAVNAANRGEFSIAAVINSTTVQLVDPDGGAFTAVPETRLGWSLTYKHKYDGKTCRVVYDTIAGFTAAHAYVADRSNRVAAARALVRGSHPVYIGFTLRYSLKPAAANVVFDTDTAKSELVAFVNTFPVNDILDASDLVTALRNAYPDIIGSVQLPVNVTYTLFAPDGRAIPYASTDVISVAATRLTGVTAADRLDNPESLGVTDRNTRYLTTSSLIEIVERD